MKALKLIKEKRRSIIAARKVDRAISRLTLEVVKDEIKEWKARVVMKILKGLPGLIAANLQAEANVPTRVSEPIIRRTLASYTERYRR